MDLTNYRKRKEAGTVQVHKIGTQYVIATRSFNPQTGEELPSVNNNLDVEQVKRRRDEIVEQIAELDALLADIAALDASPAGVPSPTLDNTPKHEA